MTPEVALIPSCHICVTRYKPRDGTRTRKILYIDFLGLLLAVQCDQSPACTTARLGTCILASHLSSGHRGDSQIQPTGTSAQQTVRESGAGKMPVLDRLNQPQAPLVP